MMTQEHLPDGRWLLKVFTPNGYINHYFPTLEMLEKYAPRCYYSDRELSDG